MNHFFQIIRRSAPFGISAQHFLSAVMLLTTVAAAQSQSITSDSKVFSTHEKVNGNHTTIYQRIENPKLKPQPVAIAEPESVATRVTETEVSEAKPCYFSILSVTLFSDQTAEVRAWEETGESVFWSNLPFQNLPNQVDFQTEQAAYSFMILVEDLRSEPLPPLRARPSFSQTNKSGTSFAPLSVPLLTPHASPLTSSLDALHRYYDQKKAELQRQAQEQNAAAEAYDRETQAQALVPKRTVIQFFPIRSVHAPKEGK